MIGRAEKVCERRNVTGRGGERIKRKSCEKLVTGHAAFSFCICVCIHALCVCFEACLSLLSTISNTG